MPRDIQPATSSGPTPAAAVRHQRAHGTLDLGFVATSRGTALGSLHQSAPLRALFPRPEPGEPPMAAIVNVAGGIAGGDTLEIAVRAGPGACATISSAAAEKVYRALDESARITLRLAAGHGAILEWLPQETILFDRARLVRRLAAEVAPEARLLLADMLVLGRAAHGEVLAAGALLDAWRIRRDGRLLWADGLRLEGDMAALRHRFGFAGAGAVATLALVAPEAERHLPALRETLAGAPGGATVPRPGLLLARFLGPAAPVRRALGAAIILLRAAALGLPSRLPRLWTA